MRVCPECGEVYPDRALRCSAHEVALQTWGEATDTGVFTDVDRAEPVTLFDPGRPHQTRPEGCAIAAVPTPRGVTRAPARGRVLGGRYRLRQQLGVGGYGVVFAADDQLTGDRVAIKVLAPGATTDAEMITRFHREAIAASRVRHPHIVDVTDFDVDPEVGQFIVMEYLDGRDLAATLEAEGALPPPRAIVIAAQCARGLAAAHRVGVLHRDLKPANIFLVRRPDGGQTVKIIDFGVSKLTRVAGDYTDVTSASKTVGTPCYMAPEQARGEQLDARCDVYALGIVLFEMLVGARPFTGRAPLEILLKHVKAPRIMPSERRPELAACPGLDALVLRAIAIEPWRRFRTMEDLGEALLATLGAIDPREMENVAAITGELTERDGVKRADGLAQRCWAWASSHRLTIAAVVVAAVAIAGPWREDGAVRTALPARPTALGADAPWQALPGTTSAPDASPPEPAVAAPVAAPVTGEVPAPAPRLVRQVSPPPSRPVVRRAPKKQPARDKAALGVEEW
jgi:hypothetical protein